MCLKNHKKTWEEKPQPPSCTALYSLSWSLFLETQQNSKQEQTEKMLSGSSCSCCSEKIATTYTSSCSFISIFPCMSLITKLWFLAISSLSVFPQETKRRKRHKRNKELKRKKKNRHMSLHSLSHMNTTEGGSKRHHKTKRGKQNRQRTKTNTQRTTTSYLLCCFSSLPLSLSLT